MASTSRGRITILTGARQTGKSTLLKALFPEYAYISLDDPFTRNQLKNITVPAMINQYSRVIWDEIQKLPELMELIKAAYDSSDAVRYILSGSSQILLHKRVSESLAGRCALLELYPLTVIELAGDAASAGTPCSPPLFISLLNRLLADGTLMEIGPVLSSRAIIPDDAYARAQRAWDHYLHFGGMPAITGEDYDAEASTAWLIDYNRTYLQRDLADLASLSSLDPFIDAQKLLALRTGHLINYSDVARGAGVTSPTARKFITYLDISYQTVRINPWFRNREKQLLKMPKLVFTDPGVCRALNRRTGEPSGHEFESAVIAEIYKQCRLSNVPVDVRHLRTKDGREVDLLLEAENGFVAVEIKQAGEASIHDCRHFNGLGQILDKPLLGSLVISNDRSIRYFDRAGALGLPGFMAFGMEGAGFVPA